ncbi:MAG: ATP-binding protein [Clostridium sp.]
MLTFFLQIPDTTLSAKEREIGGIGLFMVKKFMDSVEYDYHDELNILTLKKQSNERRVHYEMRQHTSLSLYLRLPPPRQMLRLCCPPPRQR